MRSDVLTAGAALALISFGKDTIVDSPPRPGEGRRRKPSPAYFPKSPKTPYDFARLEAAERKRERKADKFRGDF